MILLIVNWKKFVSREMSITHRLHFIELVYGYRSFLDKQTCQNA